MSSRATLLWFGLAAAFSPLLHHLAANFRELPAERYVILSPLLIGLLVVLRPALRLGERHTGPGVALLVSGLFLQILGIAADAWSIARLGLPVAVVGVSLITGRPDARVAILCLAAVPIPDFVIHAASPWLQSKVAAGAAAVLNALDWQIHAGGPLLQLGETRFELVAADSGLVTAALLAEYGWYRAVLTGAAFPAALAKAVRCALLSLAIQPPLIVLCVATLALGEEGADLGRFVLSHGVLLALAGIAVVTSRTRPSGVGTAASGIDGGGLGECAESKPSDAS